MEEKMRILNLLKEGKITTDEAARLLDAVDKKSENEEHRAHQIRFKKHFMPVMPGIEVLPETVANAISNAMSKLETTFADKEKRFKTVIHDDTECCNKQFSAKSSITIRTVSGDVDIKGGDQSEINLECCGMMKNDERDKELLVSSVSEDIDIKTPEKINLSISAVSGDIDIENIIGNIECESVSGDLEATSITGKITFKSASGDIEINKLEGGVEVKGASSDIEIEYTEPDDSKIETKSGDVSITLPEKTNAILELYSEDGEINVDKIDKYEELDKSDGYLKIGIGKKTKTITVKTKSGDIEIKTE